MDLDRFYVKRGVLYIQRWYLKVGDEIYAEHDVVAACWRWDAAEKMIENNLVFVCKHCGAEFKADWEIGASSWVYFELCDECFCEGERLGRDEVCCIGQVFARKGGKVPKEELSIEELYNIVLS